MKQYVRNFFNDIKNALEHNIDSFSQKPEVIKNILICGLGGSGIGGAIVKDFLDSQFKYPILLSKDYNLPGFVSKHTLVIVASYSGNTEETLEMFDLAKKKTKLIYCLTSGGKLEKKAKENNFSLLKFPPKYPPRAALGYSLSFILKVLVVAGCIDNNVLLAFKRAVETISLKSKELEIMGKNIAEKLQNKIPVIYSPSDYESSVIRFRQQLNENSKMLCWHHVLPEMCHNEIVGWTQSKKDILALVIINTPDKHLQVEKRIKFIKEYIAPLVGQNITIDLQESDRISNILYFIHLADFISCYLADFQNIDPVEVNIITKLKEYIK